MHDVNEIKTIITLQTGQEIHVRGTILHSSQGWFDTNILQAPDGSVIEHEITWNDNTVEVIDDGLI